MILTILILEICEAVCLVFVACVIWRIRREWRQYIDERQPDLVMLRMEVPALRNDVAALLGRVVRQDQEQARRDREIEGKIGSFLPDDSSAAQVERDYQASEHRFLSAQTPRPPSSRGSGPSGKPSGGASSIRGARNFPRG